MPLASQLRDVHTYNVQRAVFLVSLVAAFGAGGLLAALALDRGDNAPPAVTAPISANTSFTRTITNADGTERVMKCGKSKITDGGNSISTDCDFYPPSESSP